MSSLFFARNITKVTGYEARVEADQAERPPQVFTAVRIHHVITGFEIDAAAVEQATVLSRMAVPVLYYLSQRGPSSKPSPVGELAAAAD